MTINSNHYLTPTPPLLPSSRDYDSDFDDELSEIYGHTAPSVSATAAATHNLAPSYLPPHSEEEDEKAFQAGNRQVSVLSGTVVDSAAPSATSQLTAASPNRADTPGIDPVEPPRRRPPIKGLMIPDYIGMDPSSRVAINILNAILREPPDSLAELRTRLQYILQNNGEIAQPVCNKLFNMCAFQLRGPPRNADESAACIARVVGAMLTETAAAIEFTDVEKTLEIKTLKEIIKEAPNSLEELEALLHAIRDRAVPPKYKRVLEHLAERTYEIEAMKLPTKEELALKEKVLQEIVLNPEDMEQDQAAIRKLKVDLQILDLLFEVFAEECVSNIEKMEMRIGGQLKPRDMQKEISNASEKLLKIATLFPTPPKPLIPKQVDSQHPGNLVYNSALAEQRFKRELPEFLRKYQAAIDKAATFEIFDEDWPREINLYAEEHEQEILDDLDCEDALGSVVDAVEAPYIGAAAAIYEVFKRVNSQIDIRD